MSESIVWTSEIAYVVGLITTDGCLSADGRHIDLTSKDIDQVQTFARILHLKNKIGLKKSSYNKNKLYYRIQFGNINFYHFLLSIGLTPNKSKTIGKLLVPDRYFADFLRGNLDGDGSTYSYWDKRWKSSFMLYMNFTSASENYLRWLRETIYKLYALNGTIKKSTRVFQLVYAKSATIQLIKKLYYADNIPYLQRKKDKIDIALQINSAEMAKLEHALP